MGDGLYKIKFHAPIIKFPFLYVKQNSYILPALLIKFCMNGIFAVVFLLATCLFLICNPDGFLPAMLEGAQKAAVLSLSLLAVYCVWLAFFKVMEESGLSQKLSHAIYPLAKKLFRSDDKNAIYFASCNLSANLLGLPGAPTPLGVKATERFCGAGNHYAADMLFVLNATSLQLLPTTVIAMRISAGSLSASDILLPSILATLLSTLLGVLLVIVTAKKLRLRTKRGNAK